ncbi:MAG TPA: methyl-accepting chemotaxis protein [Pseudogracilibacillus sp.]|nr:methyl-accepting chemotaxis protein [Pseudogracilibacillus sp.]
MRLKRKKTNAAHHQSQRKEKKKSTHKSMKKRIVTFFRNISIGSKYLSIFAISVLLFVIATGLVYFQLNKVKHDVNEIAEKNQITNDMAQIALHVEQQNAIISEYIIVDNRQKIIEFEEVTEQLNQLFEKMENKFSNEEDHLFFIQQIKDTNEEIQNIFINEIASDDTSSSDAVYAQIQIGSQKSTSVASINRLINDFNEEQKMSVSRVEESLKQSVIILIAASIASIVIGLIIMIIISRIISHHLKKVVSITKEISKGNFTVEQMEYVGKDEIGQLSNAINVLSKNMNELLVKVSKAAKSVSNSSNMLNTSSKEVKDGSIQMVSTMEELASGAETQADSATDLTEKMQHFLDSVRVSQQKGKDIANTSDNVLTITTDGSKLMQESVQQMREIDHIVSSAVEQVSGLDKQSEQISKLVEVVKGIADQTNLLALNAAIEAARAGEHGKGFAVVADEVRKLAEQVTNSITEITSIVSSIQHETDDVVVSLGKGYEEVKTGIQHIEKTGDRFDTIDSAVSSMVNGVTQVAEHLSEIAIGSEQMNALISDIASVSEEAAAGVEQTSASTQQSSSAMDEITHKANDLATLADDLNNEVAVFKLSKS